MSNIYVDNGYENRVDYLNSLAEEYGLSRNFVYSMAQMLGPSEDFDELINALEDSQYFDL